MTGIAKAWVNFNGTATSGSATIRASFNVSSVTSNGTGDFTINFTTAMPDANYCLVGTAGTTGTGGFISSGYSAAPATTSCRIAVLTNASTPNVYTYVNFGILGN